MAKRMFMDASHPEETRVVVFNGNRLEDFDYETVSKKQLKGNIYLAKITRVEPSLQAAFVDYGGNRHGFLPFSEIHPDYYRIPIEDREALLAEEAALKEAADHDDDHDDHDEANVKASEADGAQDAEKQDASNQDTSLEEGSSANLGEENADSSSQTVTSEDTGAEDTENGSAPALVAAATPAPSVAMEPAGSDQSEAEAAAENQAADGQTTDGQAAGDQATDDHPDEDHSDEDQGATNGSHVKEVAAEANIDTVGGDEIEEAEIRRARLLRRYKIQEVIKRRQIILVQVTKEERGNKGAALTTYLSLAGRYCVLMPNTNKGGGISRKIGNGNDRKRLKQVLNELKIPDGIAVIVRTAGSQRSKAEIRRDYEYLMRLWNEIRDTTLNSTAPELIYEEANLIKRAIRDLYSRDMEEILVEGEPGYKAAKAFMKSLMPSHSKKVQLYKDDNIPLFQRHQVEGQLDAMYSSTVQLRSGGYIVLNPTEALVAIDVNSGRATRERHIESTALKTNLEAAEEIGRQLRLRDLAGLVVIDFIDMEDTRHNREVERKLKEALRHDRARIQLGRISPFGLLEMSRQRLRPSFFESSSEICNRCNGSGYTRTVESFALHLLRHLEEEGIRHGGGELTLTVPESVALYLLNQKRARLAEIEARHDLRIEILTDPHMPAADFQLHRVGAGGGKRGGQAARSQSASESASEASGDDGERDRDRGRGRRRRGRRGANQDASDQSSPAENQEAAPARADEGADGETPDGEDRPKKRRRRGKRGGRKKVRANEETAVEGAEAAAGEDAPAANDQPAETAGDDGDEAQSASDERPKRRRRTRSADKQAPQDEGGSDDGALEASPEDPSEAQAKPERPKRRRGGGKTTGTGNGRGRGRKKADSESESDSAAKDEGSPAEEAQPANRPSKQPTAAEIPPPDAAPQPLAASSPVPHDGPAAMSEPPSEAPSSEGPKGNESEETRPKRQGWWNRIL